MSLNNPRNYLSSLTQQQSSNPSLSGKLQALLSPSSLERPFEEAAFLYELYKSSTVAEVAQFKWLLEERLQKELVERGMRESVSEGSQGHEVRAKGIVEAEKAIGEMANIVQERRDLKERYDTSQLIHPLQALEKFDWPNRKVET